MNDTEGVYLPPMGRYRNVVLTGEERESLEKDFPGRVEGHIEKLSAYMAQSGREYACHEAVLRSWLTEDKPAEQYTDEIYQEGDCL